VAPPKVLMSSSHPNGTLQYRDLTFGIKMGRILYGMEIRGQEDHGQGGSSDNGFGAKEFYTRQQFQSTFSIEAIFSTFEERESFATWAITYMKTVSNWKDANWASYMRVKGPRDFDFLGILTEGVKRSNEVMDVIWTMDLVFRGGQPTPKNGKPPFVSYSSFQAPSKSDPNYDPQSIYYYPSEMDLNVAVGKKQDSIYQTPTTSRGALPGNNPNSPLSNPHLVKPNAVGF
jgi:hypothetical protein